MSIYHISAKPASTRDRALEALAFSFWLILCFALSGRFGLVRRLHPVELAVEGTVIFLIMFFGRTLWPRKLASYDLDINDDGIRLILNGRIRRNVRSNRVRYIREWGLGKFRRLVVSERGPAFTRLLWGGIGIPATLPEYEQIKALAFRWLENAKE